MRQKDRIVLQGAWCGPISKTEPFRNFKVYGRGALNWQEPCSVRDRIVLLVKASMKTSTDPKKKEQVRAEENRAVGFAAEDLPEKKKKLLNLKEESQHKTGKDKLASEEVMRETDGNSGA